MTDTITLLYSTHPSLEQARQTADALVTQQLVACCNILGTIESHYVWEGVREQSAEIAMLSKTTPAQARAAMDCIKTLHPYDCPAILQLPETGGNPTFLAWVADQVKTTR